MFKILVDEVLVPLDFGSLGWIVLALLGLKSLLLDSVHHGKPERKTLFLTG
jgi:hypothetical protein